MKLLATISTLSLLLGGVGIWRVIAHPAPIGNSIREEIQDSQDKSTIYIGKYAENYLDYLVSAKDEDNKGGWTGSFNTKYLSNSKSTTGGFKFELVKDGKELSEACQKAYDSNRNEKIKEDSASNLKNDEFRESDIWKYCSEEPNGKKVKSLKETTPVKTTEAKPSNDEGTEEKKEGEQQKVDNTYGKEENRDKLISADSVDNDGFGKIKTRLLYRQGKDIGKDDKNKDSTFKELYIRNRYKRTLYKEDLKNTCKDAYGKDETKDKSKYPKEEVFKFCSIKGSEQEKILK